MAASITAALGGTRNADRMAIGAVSQESRIVDKKRPREEEEVTSRKRAKASNDANLSEGQKKETRRHYTSNKINNVRKTMTSRGQLPSESGSSSVSSSVSPVFERAVKEPALAVEAQERGDKSMNHEKLREETNDVELLKDDADTQKAVNNNEMVIKPAGNPFCLKSVFNQLIGCFNEEGIETYKVCQWIGQQQLPLKVRSLVEFLITKRLLMQVAKRRINPEIPMVCAMCRREEEDYSHLFFECPFAQAVWGAQRIPGVNITSHEAFRKSIIGSPTHRRLNVRRLFAVLWAVWVHRNKVIFMGEAISVESVLIDVKRFLALWARG